jgi:hypothetical protein
LIEFEVRNNSDLFQRSQATQGERRTAAIDPAVIKHEGKYRRGSIVSLIPQFLDFHSALLQLPIQLLSRA